MNVRLALALVLLATLLAAGAASAQDDGAAPEPAATAAETSQAAGVRRALIVCGLVGDAEHRALFAETVEKLHLALTTHHAFAAENVTLLWPDDPADTDGSAVRSRTAVTSRESIAAAAETLEKSLGPSDAQWVFVLGHTHYDGRYSWLNIPGDDLNHMDFGKLVSGLRCREQVFFITTSASGFFLKSLAAPGRIVITATEPDLEVNETLYPHELAKVLAEPPPFAEFDIDGDGQPTLRDAYLLTARNVAQQYATGQLLATEHSLIDDTADGRGAELQLDYLSEELGGRPAGNRGKRTTADGELARRVWLRYPPAPPVPDVQPESAERAPPQPEAPRPDTPQTKAP